MLWKESRNNPLRPLMHTPHTSLPTETRGRADHRPWKRGGLSIGKQRPLSHGLGTMQPTGLPKPLLRRRHTRLRGFLDLLCKLIPHPWVSPCPWGRNENEERTGRAGSGQRPRQPAAARHQLGLNHAEHGYET